MDRVLDTDEYRDAAERLQRHVQDGGTAALPGGSVKMLDNVLLSDVATVLAACSEYQARLNVLLRAIGEDGRCRGCDREIWWIRGKHGRYLPVTPTGLNHFADCSAAAEFRR